MKKKPLDESLDTLREGVFEKLSPILKPTIIYLEGNPKGNPWITEMMLKFKTKK